MRLVYHRGYGDDGLLDYVYFWNLLRLVLLAAVHGLGEELPRRLGVEEDVLRHVGRQPLVSHGHGDGEQARPLSGPEADAGEVLLDGRRMDETDAAARAAVAAALVMGTVYAAGALADEAGALKVTLHAISCGVYGYPLADGARIAIETVAACLGGATDIERATFVCFSAGAAIPLLPYFVGFTDLWLALACGGVGLFVAGVLVSRVTRRAWWTSGVRQLTLGALAIGRMVIGRMTIGRLNAPERPVSPPRATLLVQERLQFLQQLVIRRVPEKCSLPAHLDQVQILQFFEMMGKRRVRNAQFRRDVAHDHSLRMPGEQQPDHAQPRLGAQGGKQARIIGH